MKKSEEALPGKARHPKILDSSPLPVEQKKSKNNLTKIGNFTKSTIFQVGNFNHPKLGTTLASDYTREV